MEIFKENCFNRWESRDDASVDFPPTQLDFSTDKSDQNVVNDSKTHVENNWKL